MAAEEGFHEGNVDPAEKIGIGGAVVDGFAFGVLVFPLHALVHRIDAICFSGDRGSGGEGGHGEPANGAGEPSERVALVAGMLHHAGKAAGMESLHEKSTNAADQGGQVAVGNPRGFIGKVEAGVVARGHGGEPGRNPIRVAGEEDAEAFREDALDGVIFQKEGRGLRPQLVTLGLRMSKDGGRLIYKAEANPLSIMLGRQIYLSVLELAGRLCVASLAGETCLWAFNHNFDQPIAHSIIPTIFFHHTIANTPQANTRIKVFRRQSYSLSSLIAFGTSNAKR